MPGRKTELEQRHKRDISWHLGRVMNRLQWFSKKVEGKGCVGCRHAKVGWTRRGRTLPAQMSENAVENIVKPIKGSHGTTDLGFGRSLQRMDR